MRLAVIGFSHKNTPLSLREALAFDREKAVAIAKTLINQDVIEESMAVVTCNRTEIYSIGSCLEGIRETT
ncbi:MAG: hypothetical protein HYU98_00640 [Deltaproteobacteria bacterium]|nr:hypothetical protein [Deltaproteobacteria bacterium]